MLDRPHRRSSAIRGGLIAVAGALLLGSALHADDCPALERTEFVRTEGSELGTATALNPWTGRVVIAGQTTASQFPTTFGAFDTNHNGGTDVFVAEFDADDPSVLEWSTFIGGRENERVRANAVAINPAGRIAVVGTTTSADFPVLRGVADTSYNGDADVFLCVLDASGVMQYASLLGGSAADVAGSVAWDDLGRIVIVGSTSSRNFPTTRGAFDAQPTGVADRPDAFVTVIDPAGNGAADIAYSTVLSGPAGAGPSWAGAVGIDPDGAIVLAGSTSSPGFPTTRSALDVSFAGETDAFLAVLRPDGAGPRDLLYSGFIGGSGNDVALDLMVDAAGIVTVVGSTSSEDFPVVGPMTSSGGGIDGFVCRVLPHGRNRGDLLHAEYVGGRQNERIHGVVAAPDSTGDPLMVGTSWDTFQTALATDDAAERDDGNDENGDGEDASDQASVRLVADGMILRLQLGAHPMTACVDVLDMRADDQFLGLAVGIDGTITTVGHSAGTVTIDDEELAAPADTLIAVYTVPVDICPGDFNGDKLVDRRDLMLLLADEGRCSGCATDLDADGRVGMRDVSLLATRWGPCGR